MKEIKHEVERASGGGPKSLYSAERRSWMLDQLSQHGRLEVSTTASALEVTPETIRKDLNVLQRQGFIQRVHGGAVPISRVVQESQLAARTEHSDEKERIARAAIREIPQSGTVFLESGTTVGTLSEIFPTDLSLTVVTNNLLAATTLAPHPALTVVLIGGRVRQVSLTPVDLLALENLQRLTFDVAFLGTNGFSVEAGLTVQDMSEAAVKSEVVKRSGRRILLADRSKHGQRNLFKYADLDEIDLIISDTSLEPEVASEIRGLGVDVRLA